MSDQIILTEVEKNHYDTMIDAELTLLAKTFINSSIFEESKVGVDNLQDPFVKMIWGHMGSYLGNSYVEFIPRVHLSNLFKDTAKIESFRNMNYTYRGDSIEFETIDDIIIYVAQFEDDTMEAKTLEQTIIDDHSRRRMLVFATNILNDIKDTNCDIKSVVRKKQLELDNIAMSEEKDMELTTYDEMVESEILNQNIDEDEEHAPTCIQLIDDVAEGVRAPATIYPLAASKIGKSTILYDTTNKLLDQGRKILFVTIEIGIKETQQKIFANKFNIDYKKISKKKWESAEEKQHYIEGLAELRGKHEDQLFIMYDRNGVSPKSIESRYRLLEKSGIVIDDIMIDYLGLLNSDGERVTDSEKYRVLPKEIRILSQKTNTRVFVPHQLHNTVKKKPIDQIYEDDIYFSKTIGHEATAMFILHRQFQQEGGGDFDRRLMMKWLPSRIEWSEDIYVYPNNDHAKLQIGEGVELELCPREATDYKTSPMKPRDTSQYAHNARKVAF